MRPLRAIEPLFETNHLSHTSEADHFTLSLIMNEVNISKTQLVSNKWVVRSNFSRVLYHQPQAEYYIIMTREDSILFIDNEFLSITHDLIIITVLI